MMICVKMCEKAHRGNVLCISPAAKTQIFTPNLKMSDKIVFFADNFSLWCI